MTKLTLHGQEATTLGAQGPFSKCMVVLNPGDVVCKTRCFSALGLIRSRHRGTLGRAGLLVLWVSILLLPRWFAECPFIWDSVSCGLVCTWIMENQRRGVVGKFLCNRPNKQNHFFKKEISLRVIILALALERSSFLCVRKVRIQGHTAPAIVFLSAQWKVRQSTILLYKMSCWQRLCLLLNPNVYINCPHLKNS